MKIQIISYESYERRKYGSFSKKKKKIDKFLWNTENVAAMLYKYICHIKYIYDLGRNHRIDSIVFYIWNWIGIRTIYLNQ